MRYEKDGSIKVDKDVFSECMLSDRDLGLFDNEYGTTVDARNILKFNRLDMILELNNKDLAN